MAINVAKRVILKHSNDIPDRDVIYSSLVAATGTTTKSPLWTLHGNYIITKSAFQVESGGKIPYRYKGRDITIPSGATLWNHPSPRQFKECRFSAAAEAQLAALYVKITHGVTVPSFIETGDGETVLNLSNGTAKKKATSLSMPRVASLIQVSSPRRGSMRGIELLLTG